MWGTTSPRVRKGTCHFSSVHDEKSLLELTFRSGVESFGLDGRESPRQSTDIISSKSQRYALRCEDIQRREIKKQTLMRNGKYTTHIERKKSRVVLQLLLVTKHFHMTYYVHQGLQPQQMYIFLSMQGPRATVAAGGHRSARPVPAPGWSCLQ